MKLGNLKAAIRATKGNPVIVTTLFNGGPAMSLALQKTGLLEELDRAFPGGKAIETNLTFDEKTGIVSVEGGTVSHQPAATIETANGYTLTLNDDALDLDLTPDAGITSPVAESTDLDDLFV